MSVDGTAISKTRCGILQYDQDRLGVVQVFRASPRQSEYGRFEGERIRMPADEGMVLS